MDLGQSEGTDSEREMTDAPDQSSDRLIRHTRDSYGGSFSADLLEQYKLYVQSAENVSARRVVSNRHMLTLSAAIVALYGLLYANFDLGWNALMIPVIGMAVSVVWEEFIKSYANMNRVKFKIIHELEEHLPAAVYKYEWRLAQEGRGEIYQEVTKIESSVPWLFVVLHGGLAIWIVIENSGVKDWVG